MIRTAASRLYWSAFLAYHLRGQARFPFQPPHVVERVQARRARRMVAHAYRTVPYYRETMDRLGLTPGDLRTADDLARLPLIEREQLQRDPEYFVSRAQPIDRYLPRHSGGTLGQPCTAYHDTAALFENAAHGERERSIIAQLVGKRVGYRELVIVVTQPPTSAMVVQRLLRDHAFFPRGVRIQREYSSLWERPEVTVERINRFRPDVIHTYGSYVELLFSYLDESGVAFHRPKVVWYSSDELSHGIRRLVEDRFGIPVLGTYQTSEAFKIGFECRRHPGLHVNADLYPVRVVDEDGRTRPGGEAGDIVISNLVNRGTVLLNYRLDDVAALLPDRCPCGRSLPLLSPLVGRRDELFKLASGRLVHTQVIRVLINTEPSVRRYQVIQLGDRDVGLAVVVDGRDDPSAVRSRLLAGLGEILGDGVTVDVRFVDSIPRTAGGKHRPIVPLERADRVQWPPTTSG